MPRPWYAWRGLELALLVLVASLAAFGVNAALRLAAATVPPPPPTPPMAALAPEPLEAWAPIADRDVFNPPDARQAARTTLRLVGVGFQAGDARAAVEDLSTHRQDLVRVGDSLAGGRVASIAWDHVVLTLPGGDAVLDLAPPSDDDAPEDATDGDAPPPAIAPGPMVRQTAANAFVVDRRGLAGAVDDMSGLLTQLRAVAEVEAGRPVGFRLFQIKDDSVFRRLGLQNGDVVQRVNGEAVSDPATLLAFLQRLRSEPRVALDIRRGGQRRTFVYDLR